MIRIKRIISLAILIPIYQPSCFAQIKVNSTNIEYPTKVNFKILNNKKVIEITNGTKRGNNLFHSFKDFNIRNKESAIFKEKSKTIDNIIVRVTGKKPSVLNGLLDTNGVNNFIFINPSGIYAKSNFKVKNINSLNLTTAKSVKFSDNFLLSIDNFIKSSDTNSSIEKFSFNDRSSTIRIENKGDILESNSFEIPHNLSRAESTLSVNKSGRIFVSANEINADGALFFVQNGEIILHSIESGEIPFHISNSPEILEGSINIDNYSLLEASGNSQNRIYIFGSDINIKNGSTLLLENYNGEGSIKIDANNLILEGVKNIRKLSLQDLNNPLLSTLRNRSTINAVNYNSKRTANIEIKAKSIDIQNGSRLANVQGGISIYSQELSLNNGNNIIDSTENSILAGTFYNANGGNIEIVTDDLNLNNGNIISTTTFSSGAAGNINIIANNNISLNSTNQASLNNFIISITFGKGKTGNLNINSKSIDIFSGAIGNNSTGLGSTGDVNISSKAINLIGLKGRSGIVSIIVPDSFTQENRERFNVFDRSLLRGDIGEININTNSINLYNSGINVQNLGIGNGGTIKITSDKFVIKSKSEVLSSTSSGNGGNIFISADLLSLNDSLISSSSRGLGTGGNIQLSAILTILRQNSLIQTDALNDKAGSIQIKSDTLLASPNSGVSATSNRGPRFDGRIETDIQNTQVKTVSLSPIRQVNTDVSKICGFDGNRLSAMSNAKAVQITDDPDVLAAWNIHASHEQYKGQYFRDAETKEIKPIRPVLALEYLENGEVRSIYSPQDSKYVSDLLSSLERKCKNLQQP